MIIGKGSQTQTSKLDKGNVQKNDNPKITHLIITKVNKYDQKIQLSNHKEVRCSLQDDP